MNEPIADYYTTCLNTLYDILQNPEKLRRAKEGYNPGINSSTATNPRYELLTTLPGIQTWPKELSINLSAAYAETICTTHLLLHASGMSIEELEEKKEMFKTQYLPLLTKHNESAPTMETLLTNIMILKEYDFMLKDEKTEHCDTPTPSRFTPAFFKGAAIAVATVASVLVLA